MSLATRCSTCGTVFRVVQDQLKVSEGWVRCGRCAEVFNAIDGLVDVETGADPTDTAAAPPSAQRQRVIDELAGVGAGARQPVPGFAPPDTAQPDRGSDPAHAEEITAADTVSVSDWHPADDRPEASPAPVAAPATPAAPAAPVGAALALPATERGADTAPASPLDALHAEAPLPAPGFVRRAERAERWRLPRVRAALGGAALVAATALVLQVAVEYRDLAATVWPASRALLDPLCDIVGCTVGPLRRLDGLAVESSALARVEGTTLMRLSMQLRNRDQVALRLPALDLVLNDVQGRVLARRVLEPGELGAGTDTLAAGAQLPLAATLLMPERTVVGYTIELFYP